MYFIEKKGAQKKYCRLQNRTTALSGEDDYIQLCSILSWNLPTKVDRRPRGASKEINTVVLADGCQ